MFFIRIYLIFATSAFPNTCEAWDIDGGALTQAEERVGCEKPCMETRWKSVICRGAHRLGRDFDVTERFRRSPSYGI